MRRKIAKIRRREALTLGAEIEREFWSNGDVDVEAPRLPKIRDKQSAWGFVVYATYNGWHVRCIGNNELDAYQVLLEYMKNDSVTTPRN